MNTKYFIILLLFISVLSFILGYNFNKKQVVLKEPPVLIIDTLFVPDTVYIKKIIKETITDTIISKDTVYVNTKDTLDYFITEKLYKDKYINASILAYSYTPVDSFGFSYYLDKTKIIQEYNNNNIIYKQNLSFKDKFFIYSGYIFWLYNLGRLLEK